MSGVIPAGKGCEIVSAEDEYIVVTPNDIEVFEDVDGCNKFLTGALGNYEAEDIQVFRGRKLSFRVEVVVE